MHLKLALITAAVAVLALSACSDGGDEKFSDVKLCQRACTTVDDCCVQAGTCDKGVAAQRCAGGLCKIVGCSTDADCAPIPKTKCFQIKAGSSQVGSCALPCAQDSECAQLLLKCLPAGYCGKEGTSAPCTSDADCASQPGHQKCDPASGGCICESDQKCQAVLGAAGGDWKCAGF